MSIEITNKLIDEIITRRKNYLTAQIKRTPVNNFRASDIGDCDRQMVYGILNWKEKAMHDEGLQAIFEAGNREEQAVKQRLGYQLGLEFIEQQTPFEIKYRSGETICRGHIDGKILFEGQAIPVEIKSMNENVFNSIRSLDDFQKKTIHRKYLRQMQLYLYGNNMESGIFILSNFRQEKLIPVVLDYGECENILTRLEKNWKHIKDKTYPEKINYSESICGHCGFAHICLPNAENKGAKFIDNTVLEEKLNRREELKELKSEYENIDDEIKEIFQNIPEAFVGKNWRIIGSERKINRVNTKLLPDEIREKYSEEQISWIVKILKLI